MIVRFHPQARAEFDEAVAYYENRQSGLGLVFAADVFAAVSRIAEYPEAWGCLSANTRRCLLRGCENISVLLRRPLPDLCGVTGPPKPCVVSRDTSRVSCTPAPCSHSARGTPRDEPRYFRSL